MKLSEFFRANARKARQDAMNPGAAEAAESAAAELEHLAYRQEAAARYQRDPRRDPHVVAAADDEEAATTAG